MRPEELFLLVLSQSSQRQIRFHPWFSRSRKCDVAISRSQDIGAGNGAGSPDAGLFLIVALERLPAG